MAARLFRHPGGSVERRHPEQCEGSSEGLCRFDLGFGAYVVIPDLFRDLLTQSSLQMRFFLLLHIGLYYLSSPPGGSISHCHPEGVAPKDPVKVCAVSIWGLGLTLSSRTCSGISLRRVLCRRVSFYFYT